MTMTEVCCPKTGFDHPRKFSDPLVTADGTERASVPFSNPTTLWFNTGTLCNIECVNCYIESSPDNDRLVYITAAEVEEFLKQIEERGWPIREIGLTGGEPFMNFEIIDIITACLERGYETLVLTNAMKPMMRPRVQAGLLSLPVNQRHRLTLRVSLDHYTEVCHDSLRGKGAFRSSIAGMDWLTENGFRMSVAGRSVWGESEAKTRAGLRASVRSDGLCH